MPNGWDATKSFYLTTVQVYHVKVPKAAKTGALPQVCDCRSKGDHVPFVNRPFESEIHGTVNFTHFCCVL